MRVPRSARRPLLIFDGEGGMSLGNIIVWPVIPRLRSSGDHPPKFDRPATIIIFPTVAIERH